MYICVTGVSTPSKSFDAVKPALAVQPSNFSVAKPTAEKVEVKHSLYGLLLPVVENRLGVGTEDLPMPMLDHGHAVGLLSGSVNSRAACSTTHWLISIMTADGSRCAPDEALHAHVPKMTHLAMG